MTKTKKGLLTAGSIVAIVVSAIASFLGLFLLFAGSISSETLIKESYLEDPEYVYTEQADGSYSFTGIEDGVTVTITEDEIKTLAKVVAGVLYAFGVGCIVMSVVKIILAIKILVSNSKNKYAKGSVIALLVLSILTSNIPEAVLLIIAMCQKDVISQDHEKPVNLYDINPTEVNKNIQ